MTPRQPDPFTARRRVLEALETHEHVLALSDLATILLAADGIDVPRDEVRGALERSLVGLLDVRERAWRATR